MRQGLSSRLPRVLGVVLLGVLGGGAVHAQLRMVANPFGALQPTAAVQPAVNGKDNSAGVYVRDSDIAQERFALAQRMERLKEWNKSADLYQEILQKYSDRVVGSGVDKDDRIIQYRSLAQSVEEAICRWPLEGLNVYRARYSVDAARLLAQADAATPIDVGMLQRVYSRYFPTEPGKKAAIQLMDAYFEQGDFEAVALIGQHLLDWYPTLAGDAPMVMYRTALADKLYGNIQGAAALAKLLRQQYPQAVGSIRGEDVLLADSLDHELAAPGLTRANTGDSWLTVGGNASRGKICTSTVKPGARLYGIALTVPTFKETGDPNFRQQLERQDADQRKLGDALGVMPAVDAGQLFFQDNVSIYGVDLDSGNPLPGWLQTYPGHHGAFSLSVDAAPVPAGQQLCVTINDKYVTAIMGLPDQLAVFNGIPMSSDTRLVCLDRASGRELWNTSLQRLPESQSALRDLQMGGSPLIVGSNVYVLAHGGKGQQFEDCYVICYDLPTGSFRWATYIASANVDQTSINSEGQIVYSSAVSHLAYAAGRVLVVSNVGAAACLDAYTGTIQWLDIYRDQDNVPVAQFGGAFPFQAQQSGASLVASPPWSYNPAVAQGGKFFAFPSDAPYILVYDIASGQELKRIWLSDFADEGDSTKPDTLLSIDGNSIYAGGPDRVWRMPWVDYDHVSNPKPRGFWVSAVLYADVDKQVRGRGFVTGDAVYMPTAVALRRVLLRSGMLDPRNGTYPRDGWSSEEGPGNVLVTQDHVIVAGDRRVVVYTDLELARQNLARAIGSAPSDPTPRLHYAEVMFTAGQPDEALAKLKEAFALLGGTDHGAFAVPAEGDHAAGGAPRDRAFDDAIQFAEKLPDRDNRSADATALFDLARTAAKSPLQQVRYRFARAAFDVNSAAALPEAIDLYQEILLDPRLRSIPQVDGSVSSAAGAMAQKQIAKLLATDAGRAAYQKYEEAAAHQLAAAKTADDPSLLLSVAEQYPNAAVARGAMDSAAAAYEARGDYRQAASVMRRVLREGEVASRDQTLQMIAAIDLKIPGALDAAVSTLCAAEWADPGAMLSEPLQLPGGKTLDGMTLRQARQRLEDYAAEQSLAALCDFQLPTSNQRHEYALRTHRYLNEPFVADSPDRVIPGIDALLVPAPGFSRNDRIAVWSGHRVAVYAVNEIRPQFVSDAVSSAPLGIAWVNGALLLWTPRSVCALDGSTGHLLWQRDVDSLPEVAAGAHSEDTDAVANQPIVARASEQIVSLVPVGNLSVLATSLGRICALDEGTGRPLWQSQAGAHGPDLLLANEDFVVARLPSDEGVDLLALDCQSGRVIGRKTFSDDASDAPINVALGDDGTLAYTRSDRLCVIDLYDADDAGQQLSIKSESDTSGEMAQLFVGSGAADQLVVSQGRIFAVSNQGKFVRVYSAETGKLWDFQRMDDDKEAQPIWSSECAGSPNVALQISGNYLYILSPQKIVAYEIDHPENYWDLPDARNGMRNLQGMLFGKDFLLAVDRRHPPLTSSNGGRGHDIILGCSRERVPQHPDEESGMFVYQMDLKSAGDAWQAVDGGAVYLDGKNLHTLLGARGYINK